MLALNGKYLKSKRVISLKKIEATFKIVTPMFMAGSDQKQAEFRIPSLLGPCAFVIGQPPLRIC
jgi:CRISPR/Cas system CMR-associated protein Cmr1 (group 7 of RAMP superfamily)